MCSVSPGGSRSRLLFRITYTRSVALSRVASESRHTHKPKNLGTKLLKQRAAELKLAALTKLRIDSDLLSTEISNLLPVSAPENHLFLSFAEKINFLATVLKIHSNSFFTNESKCTNCKKNLAPVIHLYIHIMRRFESQTILLRLLYPKAYLLICF